MNIVKAARTIQSVVNALIANENDLPAVLRAVQTSRLTLAQIRDAVAAYRYRLVLPHLPLEELLDVVEVRGSFPQEWSVNVPLWTKEEGRSDLVLQLTLVDSAGELYSVELDDLHVL